VSYVLLPGRLAETAWIAALAARRDGRLAVIAVVAEDRDEP
jgi:hypothetical protein